MDNNFNNLFDDIGVDYSKLQRRPGMQKAQESNVGNQKPQDSNPMRQTPQTKAAFKQDFTQDFKQELNIGDNQMSKDDVDFLSQLGAQPKKQATFDTSKNVDYDPFSALSDFAAPEPDMTQQQSQEAAKKYYRSKSKSDSGLKQSGFDENFRGTQDSSAKQENSNINVAFEDDNPFGGDANFSAQNQTSAKSNTNKSDSGGYPSMPSQYKKETLRGSTNSTQNAKPPTSSKSNPNFQASGQKSKPEEFFAFEDNVFDQGSGNKTQNGAQTQQKPQGQSQGRSSYPQASATKRASSQDGSQFFASFDEMSKGGAGGKQNGNMSNSQKNMGHEQTQQETKLPTYEEYTNQQREMKNQFGGINLNNPQDLKQQAFKVFGGIGNSVKNYAKQAEKYATNTLAGQRAPSSSSQPSRTSQVQNGVLMEDDEAFSHMDGPSTKPSFTKTSASSQGQSQGPKPPVSEPNKSHQSYLEQEQPKQTQQPKPPQKPQPQPQPPQEDFFKNTPSATANSKPQPRPTQGPQTTQQPKPQPKPQAQPQPQFNANSNKKADIKASDGLGLNDLLSEDISYDIFSDPFKKTPQQQQQPSYQAPNYSQQTFQQQPQQQSQKQQPSQQTKPQQQSNSAGGSFFDEKQQKAKTSFGDFDDFFGTAKPQQQKPQPMKQQQQQRPSYSQPQPQQQTNFNSSSQFDNLFNQQPKQQQPQQQNNFFNTSYQYQQPQQPQQPQFNFNQQFNQFAQQQQTQFRPQQQGASRPQSGSAFIQELQKFLNEDNLGNVEMSQYNYMYQEKESLKGMLKKQLDPQEPQQSKVLNEQKMQVKYQRMQQIIKESKSRPQQARPTPVYQKQEEKKQQVGLIEEQIRSEIDAWAKPSRGNLIPLLLQLDRVLFNFMPDTKWEKPSLGDLQLNPAKVKKYYLKATLIVHPDKVQQRNGSPREIAASNMIFDYLKEGWEKYQK